MFFLFSNAEKSITQTQRKVWMMEQLKVLQKQLGLDKDDKRKLVESFKEKAAKKVMPEPVHKIIDEELVTTSSLN